jgi:hypothetical protein
LTFYKRKEATITTPFEMPGSLPKAGPIGKEVRIVSGRNSCHPWLRTKGRCSWARYDLSENPSVSPRQVQQVLSIYKIVILFFFRNRHLKEMRTPTGVRKREVGAEKLKVKFINWVTAT